MESLPSNRSANKRTSTTWTNTRHRLRRLIPLELGARRGQHKQASAAPRTRARRTGLVGVIVIAVVAAASALHQPRPNLLNRSPGRNMPSFTLADVRTGVPVTLNNFRPRYKAIVITFTGINCPIGNLYLPRLADLARAYERRGVAILAINSNSHETREEIAEHARVYAIPFPVLLDPENRIADLYLAERTCETLVLDGDLRLRYRGAIDDQYALGSRRSEPVHSHVIEAIEAVLGGREVAPAATQVVGCPIDRLVPRARARVVPPATEIQSLLDQTEPEIEVGTVTYAMDVARILHAKCASCHRAGQVAPFSLLSHQDASRWATSIWEVVSSRRMPPWQADPRYGVFANDRSLTASDRAVLLAWVEQGAPAGDLSKAPHPPEFPTGWTIGTPDVVFELAETYKVKAEGTLPFQHFRVKTNFKEDKWVQAAEARPSDRSVVHHIFVYVDDHLKSQDGRALKKRYLTGYAPGDMPSVFPEGVARRIPAGADLTFEVHYTPIGQERYDRSSVGLIFASSPPQHEAITKGISQRKLRIPPGAQNHAERASWTFPCDAHLVSLTPHMHLRGVDFTYTASFPDGHSEVLLSVPRYDFNWQSAYRLTRPRPMPRGTRIDCLAHYDNSAENHANPDPSAFVLWGEKTTDEMLIGYIDLYIDGPINISGPAARIE
jgi:peroxiredoxin